MEKKSKRRLLHDELGSLLPYCTLLLHTLYPQRELAQPEMYINKPVTIMGHNYDTTEREDMNTCSYAWALKLLKP